VERKELGPKVGRQIGGGLRSAPEGMSYVDITGRVDGDNDGIVFEGIPGMERPIIPRFLVPTNLAGKLSKLVEGDSLEIERQRRAGNTNIEFDESKFNSIISSLKEESSTVREIVSPNRKKISERTNDDSYQMLHRPADRESGAPLSDLTHIYPKDVYGPDGLRFYSVSGDDMDAKAYRKILALRGKPDEKVWVYRAVPLDSPETVSKGEWISIIPEYAIEHGESQLGGKYKIVAARVRAGDIFTEGDSWHEWGYDPIDDVGPTGRKSPKYSPKIKKTKSVSEDSGSSRSKRAFPPAPTLDTPEKREDGKKNSIFGRRLGTVRGKNKYRDGSPSSSAVGSFEEEGDDGEEYTVKNYFESVTFVRDLENLLTGKKKTVTGMYDSNEVEVPDVSNEIQSVMTNMRTALGRVGKIPPDVLYATIIEQYGEDSFEKIISQLYGRKKKTEVEQEIFFHTLKNLIYSLNFSDQVLTEEDVNRGKRKITPDDVGTLLRHMGYSKVHGERLSTFTETAKRLHALKKYEESRPDIEINPKLRVDLNDLRVRLDKFKDFTIPRRFKSLNSLEGASFIDWTSPDDDEMNDSMSALLEAGERVLNRWKEEISRISDSGLLAELESIKEKLTRSTSSKEDISNKKDELENKIIILAMRDAASYLSPESQKDIEDIIKSFTVKDGSLISKKPFALKILEIIEREPIGEGIARLNDAFGGRPDGVSLRKIIELNNAGISEVNNVEIENAKDYLARYWYFRARGYGSGRKDERSIYYPSVDDKGEVTSVWATVRKEKTRNIDVMSHSGFRNRIFFKRDDDSYYNPFDLDEKMLNEFEMLKDSLHQEWVSEDTRELEARRTELSKQLSQDRVEALMNVLRATRPGYGESNQSFQDYFKEIIGGEGFTQEETREMIERIRSIFPEEWVAALLKSIGKKDIVWRKRGYFAENRLVPAVALDSRGFTVLAHEIGHGVEGLPGITNAETIFFRKIGLDFGWTDATAKKIKINSSGTEMAYDYKLMGEGSDYVSKTYPYENFELLTMGIEALLVRGDAISKFDERYLNFLLGMLGAL
jgi:hypothetical protein